MVGLKLINKENVHELQRNYIDWLVLDWFCLWLRKTVLSSYWWRSVQAARTRKADSGIFLDVLDNVSPCNRVIASDFPGSATGRRVFR